MVCSDPNARGGQAIPLTVVAHPFYLEEIQKGKGGTIHQFRIKKPLEDWTTFQVPAGVAIGLNGPAEVMKVGGVAVHDREHFRKYLIKAHSMIEDTHKAQERIERNGWLPDLTGFVCGGRLYRDGQVTRPPMASYMIEAGKEMEPKGEFDRWKTAVRLFLQSASKSQAFALLCSFAAPLMQFISPTDGGSLVCLSSEHTGTGKTTALQCAASVWGAWKHQKMTTQDTANARMLKLGSAQHLPTFYDEIVAQDPHDLGNLIWTFDQGRERARVTVDGQFQRAPYSWATILLCNSNNCLVDSLDKITSSKALGMRVIELECGEHFKPSPFGVDYYRRVFEENYGHAGHAYLTYLTQPDILNQIKKDIGDEQAAVEKQYKWESAHRCYSRTITCCRIAANFLRHMPLLPETDFKEIAHWAALQITGSDLAREVDDAGYIESKTITTFGRFIAENMMNFLVVDRAWDKKKNTVIPKSLPRFALVGRCELDSNTLFVSFETFRDWCTTKGVHHREMLTKLRKLRSFRGKETCNLTGGTEQLTDAYMSCLVFGLNEIGLTVPLDAELSFPPQS